MPSLTNPENPVVSVATPSTRAWLQAFTHPGFNLQMVYAGIAVLFIATAGCSLVGVHVADAGTLALGIGAIAVVTLLAALFLHEKKKFYLRDSLTTIVWALFFTLTLGYPVTVAARLGMNIPLQDLRFEQWDHWFGIRVLDIQAWASTHWLGMIANKSYVLLFHFMQIAILLPILVGKLKSAQRFVISNLVAFAIGLPLFALLPAVAPWFAMQYTNTPGAALCKEVVLLAIRRPGVYLYQYPTGAIGLPSFHAIWAILSVQALWEVRILRIPAFLFATSIVISTVTTGNHYVADVIAGIALAGVAMFIAERISRSFPEYQAPAFFLWIARLARLAEPETRHNAEVRGELVNR
jgi:PAP2 superfamily